MWQYKMKAPKCSFHIWLRRTQCPITYNILNKSQVGSVKQILHYKNFKRHTYWQCGVKVNVQDLMHMTETMLEWLKFLNKGDMKH